MNRYFKAFITTIALYSVLVASFVYSYETPTLLSSKEIQSDQAVRFTIIPKQEYKKPPVSKPTKEKKVIIQKKIVTPKKIIKKIVKKETPKKVIKKQPIVKKQIKQNQLKTKTQNIVQQNEQLNIQKEREIYFTKIKNLIAQNKAYPKSAQRRGIEGRIAVEFTISCEGRFVAFNKIDGKKIFKKSVQKTIESVFPIIPPKNIFSSNQTLSLIIDFSLNS
jgi:protein TonB